MDLSHLTAGAGAGCAATLLLHPLDLIKTRMQVQEHGCTRLPAYRGVWHACRKIVGVEGWLGLYQGLWPNMLGNTVSWGLYVCCPTLPIAVAPHPSPHDVK